ncbi:MAG: protein kinase [Holophagaceae bacterium]
MTLQPGARLGPYELLAPLGAGGMGEVWKAKDARLDRLVAIKVLPEHLATHPDALARFEREARAVAALNHPNITGLFDIGHEGDTAFAVMELLEGETLRSRLAQGPLPARKALDLARQMAAGLAAAHEKGIVHRDLKPDNLWVTKDGRLKILDFGLAKVADAPLLPSDPDQPTRALDSGPKTQEGVVLGTVGYMSPEQIRGHAVDARSDLFAFGVVLWEMLTGQRPFSGSSAIETLNAILTQEPPTLDPALGVPPAAAQILDHCLQKDPTQRFQSARDLGFALETLTQSSLSQPLAHLGGRRGPRVSMVWALAGLLGCLLLGTGVGLSFRRKPAVPVFHRLTFESGKVEAARFARDGQTILFSAWWTGAQPGVYSTRAGSTEARSLDQPGAKLLAVSPRDEVATAQRVLRAPSRTYDTSGTLAIGQLAGGSPVLSESNILAADWAPDGSRMLLVRAEERNNRLECPPGTVLEQGEWSYQNPRFSPDGQSIAFLRMEPGTSQGRVTLLDLKSGKARALTGMVISLGGLCWHPGGQEIWFTTFSDPEGNLRAVDLKGRVRVVSAIPDDIRLEDIAADGRVLLTHGVLRKSVLVQPGPSEPFREIGKYKWCSLLTLSTDGRQAMSYEDPLDKDRPFFMFLHNVDPSGPGPKPQPDSRWITISPDSGEVLSCSVEKAGIRVHIRPQDGRAEASFLEEKGRFPMPLAVLGASLLLCEFPRGAAPRMVLRTFEGAMVRDLGETPECADQLGVRFLLSPDHTRLLFGCVGRGHRILPLQEVGPAVPVPFLQKGDDPAQWSRDGKALLLAASGHAPLPITRLDLATGHRTELRTLAPPDTALDGLGWVCLDRDGKAAALEVQRNRSSLYVVEGLR